MSRSRGWLGLALLVGASLVSLAAMGVSAAPAPAAAAAFSRPAAQATPPSSNEKCLVCHGEPGQTITLPSGEPLYISVDAGVFDHSVHGEQGLACVDCHPANATFPHPEVTAQTRRDYVLERYTACAGCHADKYQATLDSVHQVALAGGNLQAAVCTDCHGAHDVAAISEAPRTAIPATCERCHSAIFAAYRDSVHGAALIGEGNPDVPTCIDCHGVHNVQGPSTGPFHLFSPTVCARCHADRELMAKYGLSTDILETYVADFHGTTVLLFEQVAPDQETNKPVCIDCHGVHDIRPADDPDSTVIRQNLLDTCRRCHPDATANFPAAWLGHYPPDRNHNPLVFYVNLFYWIFIPIVIGGMALFVATDLTRRLLNRRRRTAEPDRPAPEAKP
jgi:cytochrome c553